MLLRLEIYETKHYKDYKLDEIFVFNIFLLKKNGNNPINLNHIKHLKMKMKSAT